MVYTDRSRVSNSQLIRLFESERTVILTASQLGFSNSTNIGCYDALRCGLATSSRIIVPAPWARGACSGYRGEDVGIDIVVTSEHPIFHFGPITHSPSLFAGMGGFPSSPEDFWDHADIDETRTEVRAQIERAIVWGFDISHISCWDDAMIRRPEFFDLILDLSVEFRLPLKVTQDQNEQRLGFPAHDLAVQAGVSVIDHCIDLWGMPLAGLDNAEEAFEEAASRLEPGITEIAFRASPDTPELRALMSDWSRYVSFYKCTERVNILRSMFQKLGIGLTSYRELRERGR